MNYDLEDRTLAFAKSVRRLTKQLPHTVENTEDIKQVTRASASVGANYIEANGSLGPRDLLLHMKIARKEAKESRFFLRLLDPGKNESLQGEQERLADEAKQLMHILGAIIEKLKTKK